jgi:hypothetical protein
MNRHIRFDTTAEERKLLDKELRDRKKKPGGERLNLSSLIIERLHFEELREKHQQTRA